MKSLLSAGTALAVSSICLHAQTLTITAPGFSATRLFESTPGFTITGLAASPSGDLFYIETDSAFAASSTLYRRSPGDAYAAATPLFDFGAFAFGSFVLWETGTVFFGENSTGAIRAVNPDLSIDALGSVPGNYDAVFSGGGLFISHNPGGFTPQNRVSRFLLEADGLGGLQLSAADLILDTPDDYSGPIDFDAASNLFYGGSGAFARPDLYRFTAAEVAAATGAGPDLTLGAASLFSDNGTNAYLAFDGDGALWHSDFGTLDLIDTSSAASTIIGDSSDSIGHLDFASGILFANVTLSTFDRSAVYSVVPEPASASLLALGMAALTGRRCRRSLR